MWRRKEEGVERKLGNKEIEERSRRDMLKTIESCVANWTLVILSAQPCECAVGRSRKIALATSSKAEAHVTPTLVSSLYSCISSYTL